jgi:drug/metabolite transporter (DMT)-like permease
LNIYANGMYVILSFCYILPVSYFGWCHNSIPKAHLTSMSFKKPFMVMGFLDAIAGAMQVLATVYLPGTLLVLLPQAAIPLSMLASRFILRERFTQYQYLGAAIVMMGIVVVLFPVLTQQGAPNFSCQALINEDENCAICQNETTEEDCKSHRQNDDPTTTTTFEFESIIRNNDTPEEEGFYCQWISKGESLRQDDFLKFVWSLVMLASCIPMVLSTVYKQVALQVQLDPILINGWVSLFQFVCGLFLVVPAGYASSPKVKPLELPENWAQATACLFSQNNSIETGCHPDECSQAALWVHLGLLASVAYTVSLILVLKYGSASLLYLGLTLVVPLGHLVFSLHSPSHTQSADITGLIVLVAGLVLFRFGHDDDVEDEEVRVVIASPNDYTQLLGDDDEVNANNESRNNAEASNPNLGINNGLGDDKNGFLEFLREPFMLVGDI